MRHSKYATLQQLLPLLPHTWSTVNLPISFTFRTSKLAIPVQSRINPEVTAFLADSPFSLSLPTHPATVRSLTRMDTHALSRWSLLLLFARSSMATVFCARVRPPREWGKMWSMLK